MPAEALRLLPGEIPWLLVGVAPRPFVGEAARLLPAEGPRLLGAEAARLLPAEVRRLLPGETPWLLVGVAPRPLAREPAWLLTGEPPWLLGAEALWLLPGGTPWLLVGVAPRRLVGEAAWLLPAEGPWLLGAEAARLLPAGARRLLPAEAARLLPARGPWLLPCEAPWRLSAKAAGLRGLVVAGVAVRGEAVAVGREGGPLIAAGGRAIGAKTAARGMAAGVPAGGVTVGPGVAALVASWPATALLATAGREAVPLIPVALPVTGASRVAGAAGGLCPFVLPPARGKPGTLFLVGIPLVGAAAGTAARYPVSASSRRFAATAGWRLPGCGARSVRVAVIGPAGLRRVRGLPARRPGGSRGWQRRTWPSRGQRAARGGGTGGLRRGPVSCGRI